MNIVITTMMSCIGKSEQQKKLTVFFLQKPSETILKITNKDMKKEYKY
jgi:hypothetical protein